MVVTIYGIMGSDILLHLGLLSVRLSKGSLVLMAAFSVSSYRLLHLVVMSIFYTIISCVQWSVSGGQEHIVCGKVSKAVV